MADEPNPNPTPSAPKVETPPAKPVVDPEVLAARERELAAANDRAVKAEREAAELRQREDERERQRLADEGKWKEVADLHEKRADEVQRQSQTAISEAEQRLVTAELKAALAVANVKDLDLHVLADRSKLRLEGGKVVGLNEVVEDLRARKPDFFGSTRPSTTLEPTPPAPATPEPEKKIEGDVRGLRGKEYRDARKAAVRSIANASRR